SLGLGGVSRIFRRDATRLGSAHPNEPFSLAFLDPPYGKGLAETALASARDGGWLARGALIVVEGAAGAAFTAPAGYRERERGRGARGRWNGGAMTIRRWCFCGWCDQSHSSAAPLAFTGAAHFSRSLSTRRCR